MNASYTLTDEEAALIASGLTELSERSARNGFDEQSDACDTLRNRIRAAHTIRVIGESVDAQMARNVMTEMSSAGYQRQRDIFKLAIAAGWPEAEPSVLGTRFANRKLDSAVTFLDQRQGVNS